MEKKYEDLIKALNEKMSKVALELENEYGLDIDTIVIDSKQLCFVFYSNIKLD